MRERDLVDPLRLARVAPSETERCEAEIRVAEGGVERECLCVPTDGDEVVLAGLVLARLAEELPCGPEALPGPLLGGCVLSRNAIFAGSMRVRRRDRESKRYQTRERATQANLV